MAISIPEELTQGCQRNVLTTLSYFKNKGKNRELRVTNATHPGCNLAG